MLIIPAAFGALAFLAALALLPPNKEFIAGSSAVRLVFLVVVDELLLNPSTWQLQLFEQA